MEKNQYKLCEDVLRRLNNAGALNAMVIVGSWCVLFYEPYFQSPNYTPTIRTRDLDLAIPLPPKLRGQVDIPNLLEDLGFVMDFRGSQGYIRLLHPDLILEFLVPERGKPATKPYEIPDLGINAQPLRYLDFLLANTITVKFRGINVRLPHPIRFALHKLIIAGRRSSDKAERDRDQAVMILHTVRETKEATSVKSTYLSLPLKWRRIIHRGLADLEESDLLELIEPSR